MCEGTWAGLAVSESLDRDNPGSSRNALLFVGKILRACSGLITSPYPP